MNDDQHCYSYGLPIDTTPTSDALFEQARGHIDVRVVNYFPKEAYEFRGQRVPHLIDEPRRVFLSVQYHVPVAIKP
jgi:hypothetical protein